MMRVVVDTNVLVSAYLNEDGAPFAVIRLCLAGCVRMCASRPILDEYRELLGRKSLPLDRRRATLFLKAIKGACTLFSPQPGLPAELKLIDPDDAMFLECAEAAKAAYLITGNTKHFPPKWKVTQRITPAAFLGVWQQWHQQSRGD
ncbi:MAG: putative toxin-antitoxin system toxin component, PIN family [Bryobacterales bacterium]|nr:putative toxin-antitoxin system toxin component, PIN family [Bryobacterales bacterium]